MTIDLTRHSPDFATAGQLTPEQMAEVASMGFRSVIDNRPDGEGGPTQPKADAVAAAAQAQGLTFVYQPVVSGGLTAVDVAEFARHYAALPKPVLAYCRSGARCTQLYRYAQAAGDVQ